MDNKKVLKISHSEFVQNVFLYRETCSEVFSVIFLDLGQF